MQLADNAIVKAFAKVLPPIIKRDFVRKLIAFALALIVYFVVLEKLGGEKEIANVAVTLIVPNTLVELEDKPQLVSIKVRGSERTLKRPPSRSTIIGTSSSDSAASRIDLPLARSAGAATCTRQHVSGTAEAF